jgi:hypothetical protein
MAPGARLDRKTTTAAGDTYRILTSFVENPGTAMSV